MTPRLQHPRRAPSRATLTALRQHMEHALVAGGEVSDASRQSRGNGMTHKEP
jgi:hypothetical protein